MPNTCARGIKLPYQRKPSKRVATAKAKELTDNTDQEWRECIQARWKNKKRKKKQRLEIRGNDGINTEENGEYICQIGEKNPGKQLQRK